jgi:phosphate starvation-inducible PhoH-like protein
MSRRRQKRSRGQKPETSGFKPRKLSARSENQKAYIESIEDNDITLCHGPAGSGKTHIPAGVAVKMMKASTVRKIIVCRPVVGVGKDIGYLPGSMQDKVGPYLVPIFDELSHYCDRSKLKTWMADGNLEIVPLSMMRGRTFSGCFVILDEAQNATFAELRMLLTRIGPGTTMVVAGDLRQSDLKGRERGGFENVVKALKGTPGIGVVALNTGDIVRHQLIGAIESRLTQALADGNTNDEFREWTE